MRVYPWFRPWLFRMEAEKAHDLTLRVAGLAEASVPWLLRRLFQVDVPCLRQELWGVDFANPVGLAAGMDKNAAHVGLWQDLGFGFVEVGSVTARPSSGNPKPRAFRVPEAEALINRMGLNNKGASAVAARIKARRHRYRVPVGINLAKTHDPMILGQAGLDDFVTSFRLLAPHADYVVLNVSCPNTTEGKTFEEPEALDGLLSAIQTERQILCPGLPLLVKLSPPAVEAPNAAQESRLAETVSLLLSHKVDGVVATNTASDRAGLGMIDDATIEHIGRGGLSGQPLRERSTLLIRQIYRQVGTQLPIIGVGGVASAAQAYAKIRAGASLVQLYSGLVYQGPGVVTQINRGLVDLLARDGFTSIADAVGTASEEH